MVTSFDRFECVQFLCVGKPEARSAEEQPTYSSTIHHSLANVLALVGKSHAPSPVKVWVT
jgi:hypothetical protein